MSWRMTFLLKLSEEEKDYKFNSDVLYGTTFMTGLHSADICQAKVKQEQWGF